MKQKNKLRLPKKFLTSALVALLALTPIASQATYAAETENSTETNSDSKQENTVKSEDGSNNNLTEEPSTEGKTEEANNDGDESKADKTESKTTEDKEEEAKASNDTVKTSDEVNEDDAEKQSNDSNNSLRAVATDDEVYGDASTYSGAWSGSDFKAGTYTVTANLSMPGQYNPVLTGVTVYANNPNNPFGPVTDPNDPAENVQDVAPTTPLSNNATLTVSEDGTLTLDLPIKNPIFTTQKLGTASDLAFTAKKLAGPYTFASNSVDSRIYKLSATLGKVNLSSDNVATYTFKGSELYALPLGTTLAPDGDVALQLDVDLSTVKKELTASKVDCTYNGTEQTGITESELYTIKSGTTKATDAGTYSATLELTDSAKAAGYTWKDSDSTTVDVQWEIKRAELTATYKGESIKSGESPNLEVEVTGFVNNETAETAAEYTAPTVTAPDTIESGKSYELTPSGGYAKNYEFTYVAGKLSREHEFKAGTYTITSNLTIKGENNQVLPGVQIFPGTSTFPPVVPKKKSAKLEVKENGEKYLTLYFPVAESYASASAEEIFTLQSIGDGTDVYVTNIVRAAGWVAPYGEHEDRIVEATFKVDSESSEYELGESVQYPTILEMDMNMQMHLLVDWDSTERSYTDPEEGTTSWTKTYIDEAAGVTATVSTTDKTVGEKLDSASFTATKAGEEKLNSIKDKIESKYNGTITYDMYEFSLKDADNNKISLDGNTKVDFQVKTSAANMVDVYRLEGTEFNDITTQKAVEDGKAEFTAMETIDGSFVVVDSSEAYRWYSRTFTDSETDVNTTFHITNGASQYIDFLDVITYDTMANNKDNGDKEYAFAYGTPVAPLFGDNPLSIWVEGQSYVTMDVAAEEGTNFYFVIENGDNKNYLELNATIENGRATVDVVPKDLKVMGEAYIQWLFYKTKNQDKNTKAYVLATKNEINYASEPVSYSGWATLKYTGLPQKGYMEGSHYTVLSGEEATDAGTYTLVVKPEDGYTWSDGTTVEKSIDWSINRATLTVSTDQTAYLVDPGTIPDIKITVTGFVNGETAETAKDYVAPTPSPLVTTWEGDGINEPGRCIKVYATSGASAKNYSFTHSSDITYGIKVYTKMTTWPENMESGITRTYTGKKQNDGTYYNVNVATRTGTRQATDVGVYEETLTLTDEYIGLGGTWPDGTTEPRELTWKIDPAELTATYKGETVTSDGTPAYEVEVTGFVNNQTAETATDYVAPTVTAPESLEAGKIYSLTPSGGSAKNYTFKYVAGDLNVSLKNTATAPTAKTETITYNGTSQSGINAGEHYTIVSGNESEVEAGSYALVVKPEEGYAWNDGSTEEVTVNWEIKSAELTAVYKGETIDVGGTPKLNVNVTGFVNGESATTATDYVAPIVTAPESLEAGKTYSLTPSGGSAKNYTFKYVAGNLTVNKKKDSNELAPGTYQITANVYLPGELNTQLQGVTAYMTNPNNPLGNGGHTGIPNTPVSNNAKLVVGNDGSRTIIVDLVNPVFTLQSITSGSNIDVLATVRDNEVYSGNTGVSRNGRITTLYLKLKDNNGTYQFGDCTEFPTLLESEWNVPLRMGVDFASAQKTSDSTDVNLPDNGNNNNNNSNNNNTNNNISNNANGNTNNNNNGNASQGTVGNNSENTVTKLKPGKYTVTANIWFNREDTGLPLNPHITSSVFPPKDPVSNNATLIVDENNHAYVTIPIAIQSKVMTVRSISGLNISDMTKNSDGAITSITIDLGVLENPDAIITKTCNIEIWMGELAMSISGFDKEHSWPATFQLNLSGVATETGVASADGIQGGGTLVDGVNTGDSTQTVLYGSILGVAVIAMLLAFTKRRSSL